MKIRKLNYYQVLGIAISVLWLFSNSYICGMSSRRSSEEQIEVPQVKEEKRVLRSSLAGRWYPADRDAARKHIDGFFQKAQVKPKENIIALILPHAGYRYSGQTAAYGLKTLSRKYKRIVVIGPTHSVNMPGLLSVPLVTHYETPLGQVALDLDFIGKLRKHEMFQSIPGAHQREHSVQIEVPLLQYAQQDFKFVPIVAGRLSLEQVNKAANILRKLVDDETLVVASSDFVHYGPRFDYLPFEEDIPGQIRKLDMGAFEYIAKLDSKGFLEYKHTTGATICGFIPVAILLSMCDEPIKAELVKYATSGELENDYTNSVSYLSVVFSGTWQKDKKSNPDTASDSLTEEDKKQLLSLARKTMVFFLKEKRYPMPSDLGIKVSSAMSQSRAAFVTLTKHSHLRGCIGDIFPQRPLYQSIIHNAINACVNDRRFRPVTIDECDDIEIEISALTIPKMVASAEQIRIGIDGIVLRKHGSSAVYLPQVAPEQGWDLNETLTHLSQKAGLSTDAWKEGTQFHVFQAVVFGENEK